MSALTVLIVVVTEELDKVPAPEDVKAGWGAFAVFLALGVAVILLGLSLSKHLRKARDNAEHGVFGPVDPAAQSGHQSGQQSGHQSGASESREDAERNRST